MNGEPGNVFVCQKSCNILNRENDLVVQLKDGFDGLSAFGEVFDYMPPIGFVDRIVFDFSTAGHTETNEIFSILLEIAANKRFSGMEISIEGLNWNRLDKHAR